MDILNTINLIIVIAIGIIAIHNFTHLKRFRNDKCKLLRDIPILYPLVKREFYHKPIARQIIENNQEIHDLNKRVEQLEEILRALKNG
jgi:hypothetical protein